MSYRADRSAIEHQLSTLRAELERLQSTPPDSIEFDARRIALECEMARVEARLRGERATLPLLARLKVVGPCDQRWEQMQGTDSVRRCAACDQNVYNLEAMSRAEIEDMLIFTDGKPCTRLRRRADGTIVTRECIRADNDRRLRRMHTVTQLATGMLAAIVAGSVAWMLYESRPRPRPHIEHASTGVSAL